MVCLATGFLPALLTLVLIDPTSRWAWFHSMLGGLAALIFGVVVVGFMFSSGQPSGLAILLLWLAPFAMVSGLVFGRLVRARETEPCRTPT